MTTSDKILDTLYRLCDDQKQIPKNSNWKSIIILWISIQYIPLLKYIPKIVAKFS